MCKAVKNHYNNPHDNNRSRKVSSTLKHVKNFDRNAISEEKLFDLKLSPSKETSLGESQRVIGKFASMKGRRMVLQKCNIYNHLIWNTLIKPKVVLVWGLNFVMHHQIFRLQAGIITDYHITVIFKFNVRPCYVRSHI